MENIKSWRSPKTEIRESDKQGKGLFAKENIKKGEVIFVKSGHIMKVKEAMVIEKEIGEYSLQISEDFCLCPKTKEEVKDIAIFINHSCEPNVGADGQITFVALRDIKSGEELCYDYAMTTMRQYKLECFCGAKNCRKIITGEDWKRKDLQEKYGNYFVWSILKKIKSLKQKT